MAKTIKPPKVVGGINWSTRVKSKTFWVAIISAVALFANQVTNAFGVDYSAQIEHIVNIAGSVLGLAAMLGIVVDSNTKGIKDTGIVRTYTKPRDENIDPVEFQNKNEEVDLVKIGAKIPEEFDTSQPFTDDSDEVNFDVSHYEKKDDE